MLFKIDESKCVNCGACERYCPVDAIPWDLQIRIEADKCVGCTICYAVCPVDAIVPYASPQNRAKPNLSWEKMDQVRRRALARGYDFSPTVTSSPVQPGRMNQ